MTAPSLILLGHGSHDPRVPQVSHQIREGLLAIRPELDIHVAFLDHCAPSGLQVVKKLDPTGTGVNWGGEGFVQGWQEAVQKARDTQAESLRLWSIGQGSQNPK